MMRQYATYNPIAITALPVQAALEIPLYFE